MLPNITLYKLREISQPHMYREQQMQIRTKQMVGYRDPETSTKHHSIIALKYNRRTTEDKVSVETMPLPWVSLCINDSKDRIKLYK